MKNNVLPSCYNQCCHAECAYYVGPAAGARLRYSFIRMCIYIYMCGMKMKSPGAVKKRPTVWVQLLQPGLHK